MNNPTVNYVVCPVRNGLDFTCAALPTFLAQDIGNVQVILIDNDSTDGTGPWARSQNGIIYWHWRPPLGVAQSWNLALRWLFRGTRPRAAYALVVNNDVLLRPDTYRLLVRDGGPFVTAVGVDSVEQMKGEPEPKNTRPNPDYSCYLIRRECWLRVPFDEGYEGGYCEDSDHHVRMHRLGIDAHCIGVSFYHAACGTIKSASPAEARRIQQQADRNRQRFCERYGALPGTKEYEALFTAGAASVSAFQSQSPLRSPLRPEVGG